MKRALVTGGAGFIGSNLTIELVKRGWTVDIVDDMTNGHLELLDSVKTIVFLPGLLSIYESQHPRDTGIVYVHECDFAHPAILERIRNRSYDVVFHQAAVPRVSYSIEAPVHTTDINLFRSIKLLHECVGNVKKVVVASSSSVYGGADEMPTVETNSRSPKSLLKIFVVYLVVSMVLIQSVFAILMCSAQDNMAIHLTQLQYQHGVMP